MELALKQVAEIFGVAENRIIDWINQKNLPAELISDQYRFHRADLLEWAALENRSFSPAIYAKVNGDLTTSGTHLADAIQLGGVLDGVSGGDLREVLHASIEGFPLPPTMSSETLLELFVSRENIGSTAVGGGIAVPHPRQPVLLSVPTAVIRLVYLNQPLAMAAPDNVPVDTLFLMICPTAHDHLQLLARLSALLQDTAVRDALKSKMPGIPLLNLLRETGARFHESEAVRS